MSGQFKGNAYVVWTPGYITMSSIVVLLNMTSSEIYHNMQNNWCVKRSRIKSDLIG